MQRKLLTYGNYFLNFYNGLPLRAQEKIDWVFELIKSAGHIPKKYFDHLTGTDGIFEIRVEYESNIYRILCFFDKGNLVILMNAFQKKTQKTPGKEIVLAQKLKKQYFIDKKIDDDNESNKAIKK
ncbi:type II toxin-antitoxin system RelE/ParE family toxin [Niabella sp.]|uniref:type II toxin-antitoxin system RelE/ParE family toxin n=1 Tax=Niabella sp. TaxID=1962976 RepID=UPI0026248AEA|nr:type II toxin-antitoxin system RelE/ParE family toxin [Niabella sp.]